MPAVIPADVHTGPSAMNIRSISTVILGNRLPSSSARNQCVVARRPSRIPASSSVNAAMPEPFVRKSAAPSAVFYDRGELFTPWGYTIARYKLIDYLRRTRTAASVPLDEGTEGMAQDDTADAESSYDVRQLPS